MEDALKARLERARELLRTVRHVAIATVNKDGSPHNTPVFAGLDDQLHIHWLSQPNSLHSQNIARTGQAFIVIFDSVGEGGGIYIKSSVRGLAPGEFGACLEAFNVARKRQERGKLDERFITDSGQHLYCATPDRLWVNLAERDASDRVIRDYRQEISLEDLAVE